MKKKKKLSLAFELSKQSMKRISEGLYGFFSARFSKPRIHIKNAHFLSKVGTLIGKK